VPAPTNHTGAQALTQANPAISAPDGLEVSPGKNHSDQALSGVQWAGRNLVDFNFEGADLSGADLSRGDFESAIFIEAKMARRVD
jgi:hypothetical protein